jgi:hypothetical protein
MACILNIIIMGMLAVNIMMGQSMAVRRVKHVVEQPKTHAKVSPTVAGMRVPDANHVKMAVGNRTMDANDNYMWNVECLSSGYKKEHSL